MASAEAATPAPKPVVLDPAAIRVVQKGLWEGTHLSFGTSYGVFGDFPAERLDAAGALEIGAPP